MAPISDDFSQWVLYTLAGLVVLYLPIYIWKYNKGRNLMKIFFECTNAGSEEPLLVSTYSIRKVVPRGSGCEIHYLHSEEVDVVSESYQEVRNRIKTALKDEH
jgi:hypothetical protein